MEKLKTTPLWVNWHIAKQLGDAVRNGGIRPNKVHVTTDNPSVKTIAWGKGDGSTRVMTYLSCANGVSAVRIIVQEWGGSQWKNTMVITASLHRLNLPQLVEVAKTESVDIYQFKSILLGRRIKRLLGVLLTHPEFSNPKGV